MRAEGGIVLNTVSFSMRGGRHIVAGLLAAFLLATASVTVSARMSKSSGSTGISSVCML
jgi:hypothetical protein